MATADASTDPRRRSAWRVLLPVLMFAVVLASAVLLRASTGDASAGALVLSGGVGLLALWAVLDGLRRGFGASTFLGTGRGLDRLFGFAQVAVSIGVAVSLLPNSIGFLELVTGLVAGR